MTYIEQEKTKNLTFNTLENYLVKIRDLEATLKDNDKYNKKWKVISNLIQCFTGKLNKTKSSKKVLYFMKLLVHFIYFIYLCIYSFIYLCICFLFRLLLFCTVKNVIPHFPLSETITSE